MTDREIMSKVDEAMALGRKQAYEEMYLEIKYIHGGDAISRQTVLEIVERELNKGDALSEIEKLPSVTL